MGKNGKGKLKVIGLTEDYFDGLIKAPYILLKFNGGNYVVDGAPKSLRDLVPFIQRCSYGGITLSARKKMLNDISGRLLRDVKRLETIFV